MYSCPEKHRLSQPGINTPVRNVLVTSASERRTLPRSFAPEAPLPGCVGRRGRGTAAWPLGPVEGFAYPGQRLGFDTVWLPGPGALHLINLAAKRRAVNRVVYRRALDSIVHWN